MHERHAIRVGGLVGGMAVDFLACMPLVLLGVLCEYLDHGRATSGCACLYLEIARRRMRSKKEATWTAVYIINIPAGAHGAVDIACAC
jgi:hypothetical protein